MGPGLPRTGALARRLTSVVDEWAPDYPVQGRWPVGWCRWATNGSRTVSDFLHYKLLLCRPGTPLSYVDLCSGPTHHPLLHRLPDYPEPYSISYIGIHYCGTRNTFPLISEFDLHSWPAHLPHVVPPPPILRTLLEFLLLETRVTFVNPRNPPTSLPQRLR